MKNKPSKFKVGDRVRLTSAAVKTIKAGNTTTIVKITEIKLRGKYNPLIHTDNTLTYGTTIDESWLQKVSKRISFAQLT